MFEVGGGEIEGGDGGRNEVAGVFDRCVDAIAAFANGGVWKSFGVEDVFVGYYDAVINYVN